MKTKLQTANIQLISINGMVKLIWLPFGDHSATLSIASAVADTEDAIHGVPFQETYYKSIGTEHSQIQSIWYGKLP